MPRVDVCLAWKCEYSILSMVKILVSNEACKGPCPCPAMTTCSISMREQYNQHLRTDGSTIRKTGGYLGNSWCSVPMQKFVPTSQSPTRSFSSGACFQEKHHTLFNLRRASQLDRKNLRTFLQAADRPKHRITHRYSISIVHIRSYIQCIYTSIICCAK